MTHCQRYPQIIKQFKPNLYKINLFSDRLLTLLVDCFSLTVSSAYIIFDSTIQKIKKK